MIEVVKGAAFGICTKGGSAHELLMNLIPGVRQEEQPYLGEILCGMIPS